MAKSKDFQEYLDKEHLYYSTAREFEKNNNGFMCPKCKVRHSIEKLNEDQNSSIFRTGLVRENIDIDNTKVSGLLCFQCEQFSEFGLWVSTMTNAPGVKIDGIQYFTTYPMTESMKSRFLADAKQRGLNIIAKKIEKIKV